LGKFAEGALKKTIFNVFMGKKRPIFVHLGSNHDLERAEDGAP
jgi:hypothetical protein